VTITVADVANMRAIGPERSFNGPGRFCLAPRRYGDLGRLSASR